MQLGLLLHENSKNENLFLYHESNYSEGTKVISSLL